MREGRRIKSIDPFAAIIPFIMVERSDSQNSITDSFDVSGAEKLIAELRQQGYDAIGILHIIIASYVRAISQFPKINRFIRGQRIYARNGVVVNMTVKRKMNLDDNETTIKLHFNPSDTLFDVYQKLNDALKIAYEGDTDTDDAARIIGYIPRLLKKFTMWILKTLDYFGMLPSVLVEASPFHGSLFLTNMASLNIPPVRHHLYNFGNIPAFVAFGAKRHVQRFDRDGNLIRSKVVDFIVNLDDRICEGFYYAQALKCFKKCLENPSCLTLPPEQIIDDVR